MSIWAIVLESATRHYLPQIVIGEYLCGLSAGRRRKRIENLFRNLENESVILFRDRETAAVYAGICLELKKANPIPTNDAWIAALAKQHTLKIVSRDDHFDHIQGIRRVGW